MALSKAKKSEKYVRKKSVKKTVAHNRMNNATSYPTTATSLDNTDRSSCNDLGKSLKVIIDHA